MGGTDGRTGSLDWFIPESIPQYEYFLKGFDTPEWRWLIRGVVLFFFLVVALAYRHYRRKGANGESAAEG